jgi:hypothetical protein
MRSTFAVAEQTEARRLRGGGDVSPSGVLWGIGGRLTLAEWGQPLVGGPITREALRLDVRVARGPRRV